MKNPILLIRRLLPVVGLALTTGAHAQVAISPIAATVPYVNAMLDVSDVTRGLLAPRFTWANRPTPGAPQNSLLYYQTDSSTTTQEGKGYYYWDNTIPAWVHASMGPGWRIGGNTGTNPATNFIGTTNLMEMAIRTNGLERVRLRTTGQVQVGTTAAATERFEVNGGMRIYSTNPPATASDATPVAGAIRYNNTTGAHDGYVQNGVLVGSNATQYQGWYQLENAFKTRVKQKYATVPNIACRYPNSSSAWDQPGALTGVVNPNGVTPGTWLEINTGLPDIPTSATLETPYSTFWEDGRHQYLYRSADLEALGICPNTDVKGIAFRTSQTPYAIGMRNVKVRMKNESANALTVAVTGGLVDCASIAPYPQPPFVGVNGWNSHLFNVTDWQWLGVGNNMLVEYCFDNQDWTSNTPVYFENTTYNAMFGLYCDACGHPIMNAQTCYYGGPCNGAYNEPSGGSQLTPGVLCTGWGWGGFAGGGCAWTQTTSLRTCDGTFQYQGQWTVAAKRPILKILAATTGTTTSYYNGRYLLAEGEGVMIGDYTSWANTGTTCDTWQFKGPGTVAARVGIWGGNVLLSDHVFDRYYDGMIKPEDQEQAIGYHHYPMKEMARYVEQERHLPTIGGREAWNEQGGFSADQLTNQLWVTMETQSLYIKELNERMNALQEFLVDKRLKELGKK